MTIIYGWWWSGRSHEITKKIRTRNWTYLLEFRFSTVHWIILRFPFRLKMRRRLEWIKKKLTFVSVLILRFYEPSTTTTAYIFLRVYSFTFTFVSYNSILSQRQVYVVWPPGPVCFVWPTISSPLKSRKKAEYANWRDLDDKFSDGARDCTWIMQWIYSCFSEVDCILVGKKSETQWC